MSDRKTAAELRAMAEAATGYDRMFLLHLAAVEEEREAEDGTSMRERVNAMRFDRDAARKTRDMAHETMLAACAERDAAERLAADALRIGLEECERLRRRLEDEANHRRYLYGELLDCTRVLGIDFDGDTVEQCRDLAKRLGDREKVGEWWEVRHPWDEFVPKQWTSRELARQACAAGSKVVHVTRWRKKR